LAGGEARLQPLCFAGVERQPSSGAISHIDGRVPADVAAAKNRNARCLISCEHPLLAEKILKVADVLIGLSVINNWRIA